MLPNSVLIYCLFAVSASVVSGSCICKVPASINVLLNNTECFQLEDCNHIQLLGENYVLNSVLQFSNENNLALVGIESIATIQCSDSTGFIFNNITNLTIYNVAFKNCGILHTSLKTSFKVAVLITESNTLSMANTKIVESDGTGLAMLNVAGAVQISNSTFDSNKVSSNDTSGGGGVYLELNLSTRYMQEGNAKVSCEIAVYHFKYCWFMCNKATATNHSLDCDDGLFTGIGHGGAMSVRIQNYPCYAEITITNSTFSQNSAEWGGAMELVLCRAKNNVIAVTDSRLLSNDGGLAGGGGIDIEFSGLGTQNNSIFIANTTFKTNRALYGGGVSLSTHYAYDQSKNTVHFQNCLWIENSAHYASAVDIFPVGVLDGWKSVPYVVFEDCTFESNYHYNVLVKENIRRLGEGVVMITGFTVNYQGNITFFNNTGSSIYAISSLIEFDSEVNALFHNNSAEMGAGLALIGFSVIAVGNSSNITFINNVVSRQGAAIYYYSTDKHIYVHNQRCFIQKLDQSVSNVTFNFIGNKAPREPFNKYNGYINSSIYTSATSAACCENVTNCTFGGVGKFSFFSQPDEPMHCEFVQADLINVSNCSQNINTGERNFAFELEKQITAMPGYLTILPLTGSKNTSFDVTIEKSNTSSVTVVHSHYSIHNNGIILLGKIGERANLTLTEQTNRKYYLKFEVEMEPCPPLFKLSADFACICYSSDDTYFVASFRCSTNQKSVSLRAGYWVGYAENLAAEKNKVLYISYCPNSYCSKVSNGDYYYPLPNDSSELESAVCGVNRQGMLCGKCTDNTTVYFYTRSFKCGGTEHCKWGPVFYLLSEVLPLTILFLIVIFFNMSFTSGDLNGFIFFAQMYDTIADVGQGLNSERKLQSVYIFSQLMYRFFNLDYFGVDEMSFCLWKNANTLSILAFKYLTVAYALALVLVTVLAIRVCSAYKCIRVRKMRYSVIQGLSAFLVMAYSQCTEISFSILNPIYIYSGTERTSTVVFLQGNVVYFSREHLPFAIPALLCVLSFVTLVPLILLSYPLCNKVITFLKLEDSKVIAFTSQLIPMSRLKPFLDCFQGTFKDNYRFFAGLFFVYRAAILASRFAPTVLIIYAVMEFQLIIMLILHTVAWPYQRNIHNIIDALLIANLAIITVLKLLQAELIKLNNRLFVIRAIELVFVNIPLVVLVIFAVYRVIKRVKSRFKQKEECRRNTKMLDALLLEDDVRDQSLNSSTDSYMLMKERYSEKLDK